MRFSRYMDNWLYSQGGYYAKHREIGKGGDFYTAVSSSMFFGGAIANRLITSIDEGFLTPSCSVVEIGAHQGYMLADIVQFLYTLRPSLLKTLNFVIVEPHSENIEAQLQYFKEAFGDLVTLTHVSRVEELNLDEAYVVANEIFDAFSCELVREGEMIEVVDHLPHFVPMDENLKSHCEKYGIVRGEIGVGYESFAHVMAKAFKKYEFVTFDYGDLEVRNDFSIRIYYKHKTYPFFALTDFMEIEAEKPKDVNLEMLYQVSDITYDVHFAHLIDAYEASGAYKVLFKTQMAMLVEFGIIELLDMLRANSDDATYFSEMNRAKVLIDPAFMGERFKGVVFRKN